MTTHERAKEEWHCAHCAELHEEIAALRRRVAELRSDKEALVRAQNARDFERPPHYQ